MGKFQQSNLVDPKLGDVAESDLRRLVCAAIIDDDDLIRELSVLGLEERKVREMDQIRVLRD